MAIYKLSEVATLKSGSTPSRTYELYWKNGDSKWLTSGEVKPNVSKTKENVNSTFFKGLLFKKNCPLVAMYGATAGKIGYLGDSMRVNQAICVCECKYDLVKDKYLYFLLEKESVNLKKLSSGAAQQNLSIKTISNYKVFIPSLRTQQKIIDIIEPLEKMRDKISLQLETIDRVAQKTSANNTVKDLMFKKCHFEKGENLPQNYQVNLNDKRTWFLNVSAANGKYNKECNVKPNIFPGDVTLSLDGNIGLVNNNLFGFNGYLYKVYSDKVENWQIYYSLKETWNQKLMEQLATGTTIKHCPSAKKNLILFNFENGEILAKFYEMEINLKKQFDLVNLMINNLINLLIK